MNKGEARSSKLLPPPTVTGAVLFATVWKGVYATGHDGKPLTLAIADSDGHIIESGEAVSRDVWIAALDAYWQHLRALGVMREAAPAPAVGKPARGRKLGAHA
jgi:hypothetical protein